MANDAYIVFGKPQVEEAEIAEVVDSLQSGWWGTGPKVAAFERAFARHLGVSDAQVAAVNSCTAALHVSMIAADLKPGDEVITTPLTFCATVNSIIHAGATPVLADIDPLTWNIDPGAVEAVVNERTRAIIPVHYAGRPCDMTPLMAICEKHQLALIEDCAHAIETLYSGRAAGTFGQFGCFSFYVTKNVATGEGGMIVAESEQAISRIKNLALHGMSKDAWHRYSDKGFRHYDVVAAGFKYNMMDIQAALGIHQLARVDENWERRRKIWSRYQEAFADLPVQLSAPEAPGTRHAYHLYPILIDQDAGISRDQFITQLHEQGIGTGVHYRSIPEHSFYQQRFSWKPEQWPVAMSVGSRTVSLPFSPILSEQQVDRIIHTVRSVLG